MCALIHEVGRRHAGRTALRLLEWDPAEASYRATRDVSYAELYDTSLRIGDALRSRGLHPGDRVAVLLDNGLELVASEWACLLGGFLWVALNARSSEREQEQVLADCRPAALIVGDRHVSSVASFARTESGLAACCLGGRAWGELVAEGRPVRGRFEPGYEDPVRLRYTSGTAGRPKGAILPRRCYDASVEVVSQVVGPLAGDDVLAQVAPMTHAAGAMWLPHAAVGAMALVADRFEARAFMDLVHRCGVTAAFLVPTMLVRLLEAIDDPLRLASLRTIVYGGASMPADRLLKGLDLLGPRFVQIYGLTESNWPVTCLGRDEHLVAGDRERTRRRLQSCGRPTSVGELRIVTAGGAEAAAGEIGEIWVRGRNTMRGYWGGGVDAKGLDSEGWMHTGDVAFRDPEGFVTIVDRLHDMIVSGGFNVYPREVEDALSSHPAVLEAAVVGVPDEEWGERIHAVVVLRPGKAATQAELAEHVGRATAPYKKPRSVHFADELPKNASGKVLRRELRTTKPATGEPVAGFDGRAGRDLPASSSVKD